MRTVEELDALRAHLLEEVRTHAKHVRSGVRASGEGWTPVQVLQHLLLVESLVLSGLQEDGAGRGRSVRRTSRDRTLRDRLGALAVSLVFLLGIRVKMPTRRVDPEPPLSLDEVEARWSTIGAELAERLREAESRAPKEAVMRHPISGPLAPADTATFLLRHMRHHERQLRRVLGAEHRSVKSEKG